MRNGNQYDGRPDILAPIACVRALQRQGRRLTYGLEVVGFAEAEGRRYKATFLASGALAGQFDPAWLDPQDAAGIMMRDPPNSAALSRCISRRGQSAIQQSCHWASWPRSMAACAMSAR